jgi:hypothetical protein
MNQTLNVLYNVCHLSRFRQNQAAKAGAIPVLQQIVAKSLPFRQFAIPILCSMIQSGEKARNEIWYNGGVDFLSILLMDRYWQVGCIGVFSAWLRDDKERVEPRLLNSNFVLNLEHAVLRTNVHEFQAIVQPLKEVLSVSKIIRHKFFSDEVLQKIIILLHHQDPILRVTILKLLTLAGEHTCWTFSATIRSLLLVLLRMLISEEDSIIVKSLVRQILEIMAPNKESAYDMRSRKYRNRYF